MPHAPRAYKRRPRRPLLRRVLSVGIGVTSSAHRTARVVVASRRRVSCRTSPPPHRPPPFLPHPIPSGASRPTSVPRARTDASDLEARARECPQGGLRSRPRALGLVAACGAHLDVQRGDAELLALDRHVLGGEHGGVRGGLVAVRLHLHPAGDLADGLLAGHVGDVHKGVVEGGKDVRDRKHVLALLGLHPEGDGGSLLGLGFLLGRHSGTRTH
mmetsp:Transcript_1623/g.5257  ORF Transcript_1623/g.5257 Transcript_1623/m.5257 type:complete len:215 (+) Transcript_1623:479-1123(+)